MSLLSEELFVPSSFDETILQSSSTVASMECPCTVTERSISDRLSYASALWAILVLNAVMSPFT